MKKNTIDSATNVQNFLKHMLEKERLSRNKFCHDTGISPATVCRLLNATLVNPDLFKIITIAEYFNCSLDEVLGRKDYCDSIKKNDKYKKLYIQQISSNIKEYIRKKLVELELTPYTLARNCGLGESTIVNFLNTNSKVLRTNSLISVSDYFNSSTDVIIGRI